MPLPLFPHGTTSTTASPVDVVVEVQPHPITVEPAPVDVEVSPGLSVGSARTRPAEYPNPDLAPGWSIVPVTMDGAPLGDLPHAFPSTWTRTIGQEDEVAFTSPKYDPATELLGAPLTEAQLWRNEDLKTWGPVLGDNGGSASGAVSFTMRGVWWYFRRRFFGTANRLNMITNGDFEDGLAGWRTFGGADPTVFDAELGEALGVEPLTGTKAIAFLSSAGQNYYVRRRWSFSTNWPPGQLVTIAAWVWIHPDFWTGPAGFAAGLYLHRVVAGQVIRQAVATIDDETPRGEWTRLETSLIVPPYQEGVLEARVFGAGGLTAWDSVRAVLMESTASDFGGMDQTDLARRVIRYAQVGRGKSSLRVGTDTPPSGVNVVRAWQHADHEWIDKAITDLGQQADGFEWSIDVTPSTRTFRTHYPLRGVDRSATLTLRLGRAEEGGNLASYTRSRDGASVATSIVARAPGDGPDREEGIAVDTTGTGGLVLDSLIDAPDDATVNDLDAVAEDELAAVGAVVPVVEVSTHPGAVAIVDGNPVDLIDLLDVGDRVTLDVDDGFVQIGGVWRIVRITVTCRTNVATLALNRWDAEEGS